MKLTIKDRLLMPSLYPQKGTLTEQIILKDIKEKVQITQDEIKKFGIKDMPNNQIIWDPNKAKEIEIKFTEAEIKLLQKQIDDLDSKSEITENVVDLCLKIKNNK